MRVSATQLAALRAAITDMPAGATMRQRWDALWRAHDAGRFNVNALYAAGLNDEHIDTALRHVEKLEG